MPRPDAERLEEENGELREQVEELLTLIAKQAESIRNLAYGMARASAIAIANGRWAMNERAERLGEPRPFTVDANARSEERET